MWSPPRLFLLMRIGGGDSRSLAYPFKEGAGACNRHPSLLFPTGAGGAYSRTP